MKKKDFKRFESKREFHIFGYTVRITRDRPEWKQRKAAEGLYNKYKEDKPTTGNAVELSK